MKTPSVSALLFRRLTWINFPALALLALLQRTPLFRLAATAGDFVLRAPAASLLKSALATVASLGAVHTLAGATALSISAAGGGNPGTATVGEPKTIAITVTGASVPPGSWTVGGAVPPGMLFGTLGASGGVMSGTINASTIQLSGTPTSAGIFRVNLKAWQGANGTLDSIDYSHTINIAAAANSAPTIITQPANQTASVGGAVVFFVAAAGSPTPTFQWLKNGVALAGQTNSSFTLSALTSGDAGNYSCVATNSFGSATSNAATLTVTGGVALPTIATPPASTTAALGASVTFSVVATNAISFQWRKNATPISGASGATFTLSPVSTGDAADYDVVVANSAGSATSAAATLLVSAGLTSRLSNVAVRTTLNANQILIVGLTMQGGSKPVLIRAAGPALGALGIPGTMANPKLSLFNGAALEAFNDDWAGNSAVATAIPAVGAFPFPSVNSQDAALVRSIDGGRTVQVSGPAAGNLIVEAYDAGSGDTPRLTNLSARNFVGTGGDVLIAGFTIAGSGSKNVLIRAAGPSLGALGVSGTLVDPKLELYNSAQTKIGENDNYSPTLPSVFASVGAFSFVAGAKDAAIMISLPPGGYTAQISGVNGGTGEAIVEVYELP